MADAPIVKIELGQAAKAFVERVADGFGVLYEPRRIREKAKAEADAMVTIALARTKVTAIEHRAVQRLLAEERRKQANMESILGQAVPQIEEKAKPESVDEDWLSNFFDKSKLTSDEEMQLVWSRLLAGEVNAPGAFSKRTVNLVSELEKKDAVMFSRLANFSWDLSEEGEGQPLIFGVEDDIYNRSGINFALLTQLDALGLIRFDNVAGFTLRRFRDTGGKFIATYPGVSYSLQVPEGRRTEIDIGSVLLTAQGSELLRVCSLKPVEGFEEYVVTKFREAGLEVTKISA